VPSRRITPPPSRSPSHSRCRKTPDKDESTTAIERIDSELCGAALVRSWNLYHTRSDPPGDGDYLEHAVKLACADRPHILCLQEVPPWALARLHEWTEMLGFGDVTRRPSLGLVPIPRSTGRWLTSLNPKLFRSAFCGQANAVLVRPELQPREHRSLRLNPRGFRRQFHRELGRREDVAWGRERRCCQMVRVTLPDGRPAVVATCTRPATRPARASPSSRSSVRWNCSNASTDRAR